jgi:hypothetical protein
LKSKGGRLREYNRGGELVQNILYVPMKFSQYLSLVLLMTPKNKNKYNNMRGYGSSGRTFA